MAGQTTWNKAVTPAGTDPWQFIPDVKKVAETLNVPVPVASAAERDALAPPGGKYPGMEVKRTDLPGVPTETYDGSGWSVSPTVQASKLIQGADPGFVVSGIVTKTRVGTITQVILSGRITRAVADDASSINKTIPNLVPAEYRPASTADWPTNLLNSGGLIRAHVNAFVAPNGTLTVTHDTTAYVMSPGDYWTLQASWWL